VEPRPVGRRSDAQMPGKLYEGCIMSALWATRIGSRLEVLLSILALDPEPSIRQRRVSNWPWLPGLWVPPVPRHY